ncbi:OmpA family protein [Maritimibacter sp. 55A14]|uniref:OmpA family protein n=1 Tax=Maritimibacter sp. 55A14 TaxID=2174844 RepID=UPI000D60F4C4|nr:OmpA family protein [Maritimibacter sp. 55A14]PWE33541.1 OmpA family protein [Maritimibacter sp. 55A14]
MIFRVSILALLAACPPAIAGAVALDLPGAPVQNAEEVETSGSYQMPVGPYRGDAPEMLRAEGFVRQEAWRTPLPGRSTLNILQGLRAQLEETGFETIFECETEGCGGFDFRFATDLIGEPAMHVDLGDFRYLAARRDGGEQPEFMSLMVSRSSEYGYIHVTHVGPEGSVAPEVAVSTKSPATDPVPEPAPQIAPAPSMDLGEALLQHGVAVLDGLSFETGSAELGPEDSAALDALAGYLEENPDHSVALVGHTDAAGGLESNVALSEKRATSVLSRLVESFGIAPERLDAQGIGYLSPRSSNLTEDGRAENRRVEVVLTSTQ